VKTEDRDASEVIISKRKREILEDVQPKGEKMENDKNRTQGSK
jgi:hypothetical protein